MPVEGSTRCRGSQHVPWTWAGLNPLLTPIIANVCAVPREDLPCVAVAEKAELNEEKSVLYKRRWCFCLKRGDVG